MIAPDGVIEEWGVSLDKELERDANYDYKVVVDKSGTSEAMQGKPTFKLFRKPITETE